MDFLKKAIKNYPIICLAVVFVLIFGIVAGVKYLNNDQRSPEMTLEKYYTAFYAEQDIDMLKETVTDLLRTQVDSELGMAYIGNSTILTMYAQGVMDTVGYDGFAVTVDVLSNERSTAEVLGNVRSTYADATAYHIVKYQVTFAGDMGSFVQEGETCLVKRSDGRWYMVESMPYLTEVK